MKNINLSPVQKRAVETLKGFDSFRSSYELQEGLNTLDALTNKGMVLKRVGRGAGFCPQTAITYRLMDDFR